MGIITNEKLLIMQHYLCKIVDKFAEQKPDAIALKTDKASVTYYNLNKAINIISSQFYNRFPAKTRVALHLSNSIELVYSYLACFKSGMIAVPLSTKLKTDELTFILSQTQSECLITHSDLTKELNNLDWKKTNIKSIFMIDNSSDEVNFSAASFKTLLKDDKSLNNPSLPEYTDPAAIFFTSGSTGKPKGIIHSHSSLSAMADNLADYGDLTGEDIFLVSEAMTNASGCTHAMSALYMGATAALINESSDVKQLVTSIAYHKPTILSIMGKLNHDIINDQTLSANDFASVKVNLTGGDKITKQLLLDFKEKTHVPLRQGYGMSEMLCITVNKSNDVSKLGSIGTPTKQVNIRLLSMDGQAIAEGKPGVVWAHGANKMLGYWQDKALTHEALIDDWLCTGDLAYKDDDGYYWFYGRVKQLIIRQGDNISPLEIEEILAQHPAVKMAGVIGKPDAIEGEVPIAFIVPKENTKPTSAELIKFISQKMEEFKVPAEIHVVASLPLTKSNKIDRLRLKELYLSDVRS